MQKSKQNLQNILIAAGLILSLPAVYWYMVDGWNPEVGKIEAIIKGVQALFGTYLVYYGVTLKLK